MVKRLKKQAREVQNIVEDEKIKLDKNYIPELMKGIDDEQLRKQIEHELYTYAGRALFYKRCYYILTFATIIIPALVTVVNVLPADNSDEIKLIVAIFSAISSIAASILGVAKVHEHWTSYRSACEAVKAEVFLYIKEAEPYDRDTFENKDGNKDNGQKENSGEKDNNDQKENSNQKENSGEENSDQKGNNDQNKDKDEYLKKRELVFISNMMKIYNQEISRWRDNVRKKKDN